ncbi:MAG: tetratricopeptide repeat protein, partial [Calditrichaceae bacterium]
MLQKIISYFCIVSILIVFGCAYYNTFFNAKEYYKTGMEKQKNSKSDDLSGDVKSNYNDAIKKCWKLIDTYGDSSKYADDALLLIGKSYYNLRDYEKSEQVLQQFLLKYLNSEYIPEAKLWLAKNYIELDKEKEAQDLLDKLFDDKVSNEIAAQSFYILGNLYYKNENYETAIDNFQKCVEITDNDEIKGDAEYKTGEAFFYLGEYENAIYHFKKIEKLDVPVIKEYEAIIQKINALVKLNRFDEADQILRVMMGNQRFSDQFSLIQTKLANISEIQGDIDYAMELYYDILDKYPKKEGAALSSFYLGQLYEYEIGNFDSAKAYYDRVPKEYSKSEAKEDAKKRSDLLKDYLAIRDQILKDKSDLYKLEHGDSTLVDSVEVEPDLQDTVDVEQEPFEP